tara:strand:- start:215 stop:322 length:108 start_codon:yes stop_codon:yes gene_type:complete
MNTNLDILAIGNFILLKENQEIVMQENYKDKFEDD